MIGIVCVDNTNGMMFNYRRLSRDQAVIEDIIAMSKEENLYMNLYSYSLFKDRNLKNVVITSDFLKLEDKKAYFFVENCLLTPLKAKINQLILYKWNRNYPADFYFDLDLNKDWILLKTEEFMGTSHEKITKEIYVK